MNLHQMNLHQMNLHQMNLHQMNLHQPAPAPAAPAPDQGITVQFIERQIFQRPYAALNWTESLVELRKDLIPTTDFPALVNETESTYDVTVLNVYNVPDYKAMLLAEGDERKVIQDTRFVLSCRNMRRNDSRVSSESCTDY